VSTANAVADEFSADWIAVGAVAGECPVEDVVVGRFDNLDGSGRNDCGSTRH
jgi:hypothetical protein